MLDSGSLAPGFRAAEALTRENAKTFYFASRFLPWDKRNAAYAVYAICRLSDDSVDKAEDFAVAANLAKARAEIAAAYDGGELRDDILRVFHATTRRYDIPKLYFDELLDGMEMDLRQKRYPTFAALYRYCYRVAGVIGLIMLKLFGQRDARAEEHAIELGVAMQLTNILRDVGEDFQKGRIYLPQDELGRFGVSEADIAAASVTERLRELLKYQIERARQYYARAESGIKMIADARSRFVALAMKEIYAGILKVIEDNGYDVFSRRASVSGGKKLLLALRILLSGRYL